MLTVPRNDAVIKVSRYLPTLSGAYTASTWTSDGLIPITRDHHSAFVTDKTSEKSKPSEKEKRSKGGQGEKKSLSESIECFVCGNFGHYERPP